MHQRAALPGSPGDRDVSMELTNMYTSQPEAAAADVEDREVAEPIAAATVAAAAQPASPSPVAASPSTQLAAAGATASPEPLMHLEDEAAAPAAEVAEAVEVVATPAAASPAAAAPAPAADPYELPQSPAQAPVEVQAQLLPQQLALQLESPTAAPASSQLAVGSPPPALDSPQQDSGALLQGPLRMPQWGDAAPQPAAGGSPEQASGASVGSQRE